MTTGIIKKVLQIIRNKKKKCNKILALAKNKLSSIETLIFQYFIDLEISYEEYKLIVNEKEKYKSMKKYIRMMKSSGGLNKEKSKITEI